MRDLPSLNGLRAFEAVARRGSVKDAAAELFVTPGAVSQQVKALEGALGMPLLRRVGTGVELTAAGASLYPVLQEAFAAIVGALERLHGRARSGTLTVSVLPSFASKWLVPRLGRFRAVHPGIDVRISASSQMVDLARDDVDVAVRLGRGDYPGLRCDFLFNEPMFPVCSPELARGTPPLREPAHLAAHTLLHDETYKPWQMWLDAWGVQGVQARRGPVFSDASMVLQAAMQHQGVAMARGELVAEDLRDGRLVKPFDLELPYRSAYYLVTLPAVADWPKVAAFRTWMIEEVQRYLAEREAHRPEAGDSTRGTATAPPVRGLRAAGRRRRQAQE